MLTDNYQFTGYKDGLQILCHIKLTLYSTLCGGGTGWFNWGCCVWLCCKKAAWAACADGSNATWLAGLTVGSWGVCPKIFCIPLIQNHCDTVYSL